MGSAHWFLLPGVFEALTPAGHFSSLLKAAELNEEARLSLEADGEDTGFCAGTACPSPRPLLCGEQTCILGQVQRQRPSRCRWECQSVLKTGIRELGQASALLCCIFFLPSQRCNSSLDLKRIHFRVLSLSQSLGPLGQDCSNITGSVLAWGKSWRKERQPFYSLPFLFKLLAAFGCLLQLLLLSGKHAAINRLE